MLRKEIKVNVVDGRGCNRIGVYPAFAANLEIPAQAGVHASAGAALPQEAPVAENTQNQVLAERWVPAFAGTTKVDQARRVLPRPACGERGRLGIAANSFTKLLMIGAVLLLSTSGATAQQKMGAGARAVLQTCKPDIAHFCSQVPPGQGRVKACMKEHVHELSEPCKEALFQAWLKQ